MLVTKQVVDRLHWVESAERNLYEHRVPVAHRTIPKTGQLERLQFLAVLALVADKSCLGIHILRQVEIVALKVLSSANKVYRIEVSALRKHIHILLVVLVDL